MRSVVRVGVATMALSVPFLAAPRARAVEPWPGEAWSAAADLTYLNPTIWSSNLSGAYWNPVTRRLWLANNSGTFTVLKEDGMGGFAKERDYTPDGDLEGITQADPSADRVYLMVETGSPGRTIRAFRPSDGSAAESWFLDQIPDWANSGCEGIAFIPDYWLAASGFRDGSGNLYPQSVHGADGLRGIMLVAVQTSGWIYAVDLRTNNTYTLVGRYLTSQAESAEVTFDASIGRLYVLHNISGNTLEVADLTSSLSGTDRKFNTLHEFQVPSGSNIEGFGLTPALNADGALGDRWCFFTDDGNAAGALRWFRQLPSRLSKWDGDAQVAPVATTVPVPPSVAARDVFRNPLPGFAVTFVVTSGGGSVVGGSARTGASGVAAVGSWTLGPSAGSNTLSAAGTGLEGSPVRFTAVGTEGPPSARVLVATNAVWKYLDNGTDQGATWRGSGFDDASWNAGPAPLGYGDPWIFTTVSYGPNASAKYITTYFRRSFVVAEPAAYSALRLRLNRDDGAVVYINGVEARRDLMPAGAIAYDTLATQAVGGSDESAYFASALSPSLLLAGTNVLAVEVHQARGTSSDLSFALELSGSPVGLRKGPYLIYPNNPTKMRVLWQTDATPARSSYIEWGATTGYGHNSGNLTESGAGVDEHQFSHLITGLTPGARCFYRVAVDSQFSEGSFVAAPSSGATNVTFYGFGDTRTYPDKMASVTAAMIRDAQSDPEERQTLALHVGDWVESGGTETGWQNEFFNRGYASSLAVMSGAAMMGCRGNHDLAGGTTLMPKYWPYNGTKGYYSFDYGPVHVTVIDQYDAYTAGSAQYTWLTNDLAGTAKKFRIALFHEPAYSAGGGHANDATAQATLCPLFGRYGVQLALAGHNHYYAHCYTDGVHHVTAGGGGAPLHAPDPGAEGLVAAESAYSFVRLAISNSAMTVTAIRTNDTVIERFRVYERFTLSYLAGLGGAISGANPQRVDYRASGSPVRAVPSAGYRFVGWSDGVARSTRTETNVTADVTVTADFAERRSGPSAVFFCQ